MSDTTVALVVPQEVREFAVNYAIARKMPKGKIEGYRTGAADADPLVQAMTLLYAAAKSSNEGDIVLLKNKLRATEKDLDKLKKDLVDATFSLKAVYNRLHGSWWNRISDLKALLP